MMMLMMMTVVMVVVVVVVVVVEVVVRILSKCILFVLALGTIFQPLDAVGYVSSQICWHYYSLLSTLHGTC
jgi:hypothetical protein